MPDEITPEQWREWRDDPRTKRVAAKMEIDAMTLDEMSARARNRAIAQLDHGGAIAGADLQEERRIMTEYRIAAGTVRRWMNIVKSPGELAALNDFTKPTGTEDTDKVAGGRRIHVKG